MDARTHNLQKFTANVLMSDTTVHLQKASGALVSMDQSGFGDRSLTHNIKQVVLTLWQNHFGPQTGITKLLQKCGKGNFCFLYIHTHTHPEPEDFFFPPCLATYIVEEIRRHPRHGKSLLSSLLRF